MDYGRFCDNLPKREFLFVHGFITPQKVIFVGIAGVWWGVDNAWEQEKLEARKLSKKAAESHTSGARCVRQR